MRSYTEEVAKAIAGVFRAASISHGGIIFFDHGRPRKIGAFQHNTASHLNQACDELVILGRHPALEMARYRLTPFDLLSAPDRPAEDPIFNEFAAAVERCGIPKVLLFPLRNTRGDLFVASGASRTHLRWAEVRIIHTFCLDAIAEVDANHPGTARPFITERERTCLKGTAIGKTEKEIARELGISPSTVHAHLENCKRKLGARNRTDLVVRAIHAGLIDPSEI